ncbi:tetratricopeptide repeat protein [Chryseobacterium sp. M5A1_1a]
MKKISVFILIFLNFIYHAQTVDEKKIDSLLDKSDDLFSEAKFSQSLDLINEALQLSKEKQYSKGIVFGNLNIAGILLETGVYTKSLTHLENAEKEPYFKKDFYSQYEFYRIRGRIRDNLEMHTIALKDFQKSLAVAYQIPTPNRRRLSIFYSHQNLLQSFERFKKKDSIWHHLSVMEKELAGFDFDKKRYCSTYIYTYTKIAEKLISEKQFDKAEEYLGKSLVMCQKYEFPVQYDILEMYGNLEVARNNIDKAAEYYRNAFEVAYKLKLMDQARYLSGVLAELYTKRNLDPVIANKYLYLHNNLHDSLETVNKNVIDKVVGQVLHEEKKEQKEKEFFYMRIIGGIALLLLVGGGYFYIRIKKNKKLLKRNKLDLFVKNALAEELGKKVEENKFHDLLERAKSNNPEFLILFTELYPQFIQTLKNIDPKIRSSELSFCAMSYLNFSAKDIATYTFVTLGAVEMRRSRLRKKYNIPSDIDFNNWMRMQK